VQAPALGRRGEAPSTVVAIDRFWTDALERLRVACELPTPEARRSQPRDGAC